jgi:HEAT repeat protein
VLQVHQFRILAEREDAEGYLRELAKRPKGDPVGALGRFELAYRVGAEAGAAAAMEVIKVGHPVMVESVLTRVRERVDEDRPKAAPYARPLLAYIRSVQPNPRRLGKAHDLAAIASATVCNIGTSEALQGLRKILAGPHSAVVRATLTGLSRAENDAAAKLAQPLLKSPYGELSTVAALVMARFKDPGAEMKLWNIVLRPQRHSTELNSLAAWYFLKISRKEKQAVAAMTKALSN